VRPIFYVLLNAATVLSLMLSVRTYGAPAWLLIALTSTPPLIALRRIRCRRREANCGRCPACGYDLRATPDRCPECGAVSGSPEV
jgi:hypothetical protein